MISLIRKGSVHALFAIIWAMILAINLICLATRLDSQAIDANLNSILPQAENAEVRQALKSINHNRNRQLLIAVRFAGQADEKLLDEIAQIFPKQKFTRIDTAAQSQAVADWYQQLQPYRQQLLSERDKNDLQNGRDDSVVKRALAQLYGFAGVSPTQFARDPLFLFQRYFMQTLPQNAGLSVQGNWLLSDYQGKSVAVLPLTLSTSAFNVDFQQDVKQHVARATQIAKQHDTTLSAIGTVVFAEHGFSQSKREMSTVGIGGLMGIVLLLCYAFRSLRPLILLLSALGVSLAVALNVTLWAFGSIHMVSLLFSASMIGVSIDYGFHFLSDYYQHRDNAKASIKRILSGLLLGLFSSVLAYALFLLSGLLLLKQVALLAIIGLPAMFLTVTLILPYAYGENSRIKPMPKHLQQFAHAVVNNPLAKVFSRPLTLLIAFVILTLGYAQLTPNDDIRNLQAIPKNLLKDEQLIRGLFKKPYVSTYAFLSADSAEQLLSAERQLITENPALFHTESALTNTLPTTAQQRENHALYQQFYAGKAAQNYQAQLGNSADLSLLDFAPMPIEKLLQSDALKQRFSQRLLHLPDARWALLMPALSDQVDANICNAVKLSVACHVIRPTEDLSAQFAHYRQQLSRYLLLAGALLLGFAWWRYGKRGALIALLPMFSATAAVVFSDYLATPLSLFSVLAALLVLGMGLDYVIFLAEASAPDKVMVSLSLSYLTTLLSFGLLVFSQTTAVATFGLVTAIGMTLVLLLSPAVVFAKR